MERMGTGSPSERWNLCKSSCELMSMVGRDSRVSITGHKPHTALQYILELTSSIVGEADIMVVVVVISTSPA